MQALAENNTAVVFCNKKHHPSSMLFHLDTNSVQTQIFTNQINATEPLKKNLWKQIIENKIKNQAALIKKIGKNEKPLLLFASKVNSDDTTNREAQASRYYWQNIFNIDNFKRERFGMPPNPSLNYGYSILRAAVARALTGSGLLPTIGIHHHNKYNAYCLADNIMEPYRPFVDECVLEIMNENSDYHIMDKNQKANLLNILNMDVRFNKFTRPLMVGLSITTASLVKCFSGEVKKINYPELIN
jgi:CRISPR-associated protein Cas1